MTPLSLMLWSWLIGGLILSPTLLAFFVAHCKDCQISTRGPEDCYVLGKNIGPLLNSALVMGIVTGMFGVGAITTGTMVAGVWALLRWLF